MMVLFPPDGRFIPAGFLVIQADQERVIAMLKITRMTGS